MAQCRPLSGPQAAMTSRVCLWHAHGLPQHQQLRHPCPATQYWQRPAKRRRTFAAALEADDLQSSAAELSPAEHGSEEGPRDDDVLPNSLGDALDEGSQATADALGQSAMRCIVEVLLPEFFDPSSGPIFAEEGDQQRFWKLTRRFIESLGGSTGITGITAVYPDMGVAAMLQNQWRDAGFSIASLTDRQPVREGCQLVIIAAPDPQGLEAVKRIASATEERGIPLVLFNPRLASGDVGVGLNVRRLTSRFLTTFTTTYSLRPIGDMGSVFRRYPQQWKVFVEDAGMPGRYRLIAERPSRPAGEALDAILEEAMQLEQGEEGASGPGLLASLGSTVVSLRRFAKSLSR